MSNQNIENLVAEMSRIMDEAGALKEDMNELSEWDSLSEIISNTTRILQFCTNLVVIVEIAATSAGSVLVGLKSQDKLDAAVTFLDNILVLPWYLELVDDTVIRMILTLAVDTLNKKYGKDWDTEELSSKLEKGEVIE